jgi:hypothetical protein
VPVMPSKCETSELIGALSKLKLRSAPKSVLVS